MANHSEIPGFVKRFLGRMDDIVFKMAHPCGNTRKPGEMIQGERRLRRDFLNASLITTAAAALVACEPVQQLIKKTVTAAARRVDNTSPPPQPAPAIPEATASVITEPASTAEPTLEPTPTWLVGKAPENDSDFIFGAGGSQDQIEQEIIKNGGEEKLKAQINFYTAVLTEQEKQIQMRIALGEKGLDHINVNAFQFDLAFAEWSDAQNQPHFSWEVLPQSNGTYWYVQERRAQIDAQGNPVLDTQKNPVYDYVTESNGNALRVYNNSAQNYRLIAGVAPEGGGQLKEVITPSKEGWFWVGYYDKAGKCLFLKDLANDKNNPTSFFRPPDSTVALVREEPTSKEWQALDINGQVLYTYYPDKQEWVTENENKWIDSGTGWLYNKKLLLGGDIAPNPDKELEQAKYEEFLKGFYNLQKLARNDTYLSSAYGITSEAGFIVYTKSGKPLKGLFLPLENALDVPERFGGGDRIPKLIKSGEKLYLDKIAVRVLHRDQTELFYSLDDLANKSLNYDLPTRAFLDYYTEETGDKRKYVQITLTTLNSGLGGNWINNRYTFDAIDDTIPVEQGNLWAANQNLNFLIRMLKANEAIVWKNKPYLMPNSAYPYDTLPRSEWPKFYQDLAEKEPLFVNK